MTARLLRRRRGPGAARIGGILLVVACSTWAPGVADASTAASWSTGIVRFQPAGGAALEVDGLGTFRGTIELRHGASGVTIVNEIALEDYVRGIQEVPTSWPAATQEAQAVAARTFALHTMLGRRPAVARAVDAHICATQSCQVYRGLDGERRPGGSAWVRAVDATAGRVLLHRGGPILAKYASSNGGRSEAGGAPYLPAVHDPDDLAVSPWARWRSTLPLATVARALPGPGTLVEVNRAGDVVVARRRQPDGTVLDQGYSPRQVRAALNATAPTPPGVPVPVPSTRFVARTEAGSVTLDGGGYGHLLGMSQYGALGKARRGFTADDILAAYYGGIRPTAVPAAALPRLIRVVLATDEPAVTVRSAGRFQVVAADGGNIAHLTGGSWTASPGAGGLTVTSNHATAPQLTVGPLGSRAIHLGISLPSRVVVRESTGAVASLGLLDRGRHELALSAPPPPGGSVELRVEADAGGGRIARATLRVVAPPGGGAVTGAPVAAVSAGPATDLRPAPGSVPAAAVGLAVACLVAAAGGTAAAARRRR